MPQQRACKGRCASHICFVFLIKLAYLPCLTRICCLCSNW